MSNHCRHSTASPFGTQGRYCDHCHYAITETADERDARHRAEGAASERAKVVAWMRWQAVEWGGGIGAATLETAADAIERADHDTRHTKGEAK